MALFTRSVIIHSKNQSGGRGTPTDPEGDLRSRQGINLVVGTEYPLSRRCYLLLERRVANSPRGTERMTISFPSVS